MKCYNVVDLSPRLGRVEKEKDRQIRACNALSRALIDLGPYRDIPHVLTAFDACQHGFDCMRKKTTG